MKKAKGRGGGESSDKPERDEERGEERGREGGEGSKKSLINQDEE